MRLLVLGGTHSLGGVRALHGDRDDPGALPRAGGLGAGARRRHLVPYRGRGGRRRRRAGWVGHPGYASVSSLNAYATWPPGPVGPEGDEPTWDTADDDPGPNEAHAERVLGAALPGRFLTARAGLVLGPRDPVYRLGWWLDRISSGGRVVVPAEGVDQPVTLLDARDLAARLVESAGTGRSGAVNAAGPVGPTLGSLLDLCREVTGSGAEWVPVPGAELLAAGVQDRVHLPLWLARETARTAWDLDTTRAREPGLTTRPTRETVADTWAWMTDSPRPPLPADRPAPGLPVDLESALLAGR